MQAEQPNHNKIDQQFEDFAWTQMNILLDEEMPVQKKKRRWLLILFLLFGLGAGSTALYFILNKSEPIVQQRQAPIAEANTNDFEHKEATEKVNSVSKSERIQSNIESTKPNIKSNNVNTTAITNNYDNTPTHDINISKSIDYNKVTIAKVPNPKDLYPMKKKQNEHLEKHQQNIAEQIQEQRSNILVHPMNVTPIEPLASAMWSITTEPDIPQRSKWYVGVQAGGIATFDEDKHAVLGTKIAYQIAPKWEIASGIDWIILSNYNLTSLDAIPIDSEMDLDTSIIVITSDPSGVGAGNNVSSFPTSKDYHFLNIPLSLSYQVSNRFSIYGGGESLLPLGNTKKSAAFTAELCQNSTRVIPEKEMMEDDMMIEKSWQWHTGIEYRMSKNWNIDISYHRAFSKLQPKNHLNQFAQLRATYRIK